eukprot:1735599-Rhodomonas_salina.3
MFGFLVQTLTERLSILEARQEWSAVGPPRPRTLPDGQTSAILHSRSTDCAKARSKYQSHFQLEKDRTE